MELAQELERKRELADCMFCIEKNNKLTKYLEDIEHEKILECQKALEREKIAKGMQSTKQDIMELKDIQKMQIMEKKNIEKEHRHIENMWHRILLNDVKLKEEKERLHTVNMRREMYERRTAYDEQIASANRRRKEDLRREREIENSRLAKMTARMEEDYYNAIKRKNEQQQNNKANYIECHRLKVNRRRQEKQAELEVDNRYIQVALNDLRSERHRKMEQIKSLQRENHVFTINYNQERRLAEDLEREVDRTTEEWKQKLERDSENRLKEFEREKQLVKEVNIEDYKRYLKEKNEEYAKCKHERNKMMEHVKETALKEVQIKLNKANDELRKQIEHRNNLNKQIRENQRAMNVDKNIMEEKQSAFTKKAHSFREAMQNKINPSRASTNPVHPFRKHLLQCKNSTNKSICLPIIDV